MSRGISACAILFLLSATSVSAFDGNRKGFVLGGGVGFAPGGSVNDTYFKSSGMGPGLSLIIGGGFNDQLMLVYEINTVMFWVEGQGDMIVQGFSGPTLYAYVGDVGKSFFVNIGIGNYIYSNTDFETNDPGLGVLLGCGYEFSRHYKIGGYFSFGTTTYHGTRDFDHNHLNILFCGTAF